MLVSSRPDSARVYSQCYAKSMRDILKADVKPPMGSRFATAVVPKRPAQQFPHPGAVLAGPVMVSDRGDG
jgi:hypothetical protein